MVDKTYEMDSASCEVDKRTVGQLHVVYGIDNLK